MTFLSAAIDALNRHGVICQYKKVQEGTYNVETSSSTNTEVLTSIKAFPKAVKVSQYNYPNLVGKTVIQFLIAGNAGILPSAMDKIVFNSEDYTVDSFTEHYANQTVILWKILCVKG